MPNARKKKAAKNEDFKVCAITIEYGKDNIHD
jgi:hypothetical protein